MDKTRKKIIETCIKIARRGEGALVVYGKLSSKAHKPLIKQNVKPFKIETNPKLFESLALIDGAVLVNDEGKVYAYGTKIKSTRILKNFGTRHSAGLSASAYSGVEVFVVSEEDRKVRIFKNKKLIIQIDALEKGMEKKSSEINNLLESIGIGTLGTVGTAILAPAIGISLIPGVIIFGGAYYLIKRIKESEKKKQI